MVSISACHAEDPGSIPGGGVLAPSLCRGEASHCLTAAWHPPPLLCSTRSRLHCGGLREDRRCQAKFHPARKRFKGHVRHDVLVPERCPAKVHLAQEIFKGRKPHHVMRELCAALGEGGRGSGRRRGAEFHPLCVAGGALAQRRLLPCAGPASVGSAVAESPPVARKTRAQFPSAEFWRLPPAAERLLTV